MYIGKFLSNSDFPKIVAKLDWLTNTTENGVQITLGVSDNDHKYVRLILPVHWDLIPRNSSLYMVLSPEQQWGNSALHNSK